MSMTAQEVFDHVLDHLREQGVVSADERGNCAYRGSNGLQCAVGCLIEDGEYRPAMEGNCVRQLKNKGLLPESLQEHAVLLNALQCAHDYDLAYGFDQWEAAMGTVARRHGLECREAA